MSGTREKNTLWCHFIYLFWIEHVAAEWFVVTMLESDVIRKNLNTFMTNPSVVRIKYGTIIEWSSTMWLVQSVGDIFFFPLLLCLTSCFYWRVFFIWAIFVCLLYIFESYLLLIFHSKSHSMRLGRVNIQTISYKCSWFSFHRFRCLISFSRHSTERFGVSHSKYIYDKSIVFETNLLYLINWQNWNSITENHLGIRRVFSHEFCIW